MAGWIEDAFFLKSFLIHNSCFTGQTPSTGHHADCSGETQLHPISSNSSVPRASQPQRCQSDETEIRPELQEKLTQTLRSGPQA